MVNFSTENVNDIAYIIQKRKLYAMIYRLMINKNDRKGSQLIINHLTCISKNKTFDLADYISKLPQNDPIKRHVKAQFDVELDNILGVGK